MIKPGIRLMIDGHIWDNGCMLLRNATGAYYLSINTSALRMELHKQSLSDILNHSQYIDVFLLALFWLMVYDQYYKYACTVLYIRVKKA